MSTLFRILLAPAIVSAYTTYGVISAVRAAHADGARNPRLRDCLAGSTAGFAHGSYYVMTGQRLDSFLFQDKS